MYNKCRKCEQQGISYIDMTITGFGDFWWYCADHESEVTDEAESQNKKSRLRYEIFTLKAEAASLRRTADKIDATATMLIDKLNTSLLIVK